MPRKSTASIASIATPSHMIDNVTMVTGTSSIPNTSGANTNTPKELGSPSRTKSQAQSSKIGEKEKGGRKPGGGARGADDDEPIEKTTKAGKSKNDDMTIDDLLLPRSLISRLARGSLPPNTSLQKDALLALTKSATVFISYLAHTSNQLTSRKTIQAQDVLEAIREIELDGIVGDRLISELKVFEEGVRGKRRGYRDRVKARESGVSVGGDGDAEDEVDQEGEAQHVNKRVRRDLDDLEMRTEDTGSEADPSTQLLAEVAATTQRQSNHGGDDTGLNSPGQETDEEDVDPDTIDNDEEDDDGEEEEEEEGEEGDEDEDEEDDDEDENRNGSRDETLEMDDVEVETKRKAVLAPDGRVEVDTDDESD